MALAGAPIVVDNGAAGFSTTGSWGAHTGGLGGNSLSAAAGSGATASWTVTGLTAGTMYQVAASWPAGSTGYGTVPYTVRDANGVVLARGNVNQYSASERDQL